MPIMKTSILFAAVISGALSAPIASAQDTSTPAKPAMNMDMDKQMPKMQEHMQKGTGGSPDMKRPMMAGMDSMQKMPMSGDTDKDFAMMMKIHHQQAVDMAQMELEHGKSPAMKAMAKQIIAAQKKEIAKFDQWLAKQK
jgi:uncharacterized protein (DUF305 family)